MKINKRTKIRTPEMDNSDHSGYHTPTKEDPLLLHILKIFENLSTFSWFTSSNDMGMTIRLHKRTPVENYMVKGNLQKQQRNLLVIINNCIKKLKIALLHNHNRYRILLHKTSIK